MRATAIRTSARLWLTLLAATALLGAGTPGASAATVTWSACSDLAGFECGTLDVPVNGQSPSAGSVRLAASRLVASDNPTRSAVIGLAGGPGQAALPLRETFATVLASAITNRDLLIFDQRGTGQSDPLVCGALRTEVTLLSAVSGCANELGGTRRFYRTQDSVADLEALRIAGGYEKLVLFGVSYGTKVAQEYASTYPARVEALVLDSVVLPAGLDPFLRSSLAATRRVLRDLCAKGSCRDATPNVVADLNAVAALLRGRRVTGRVTSAGGKRTAQTLNQPGLVELLLAGDTNPTLRAELPGSLRAARRDDWTPLLRLSRRANASSRGSQASRSSDSLTPYLATLCEETPFPWPRAAGPEQRWAEASAAATKLTPAERGPFSARTALEAGTVPLCLGWPTPAAAPADPGPLPQVPTLVLTGQMDLRTPVEDARQIKTVLPDARVAEIPFAGHSVLTGGWSKCSAQAVTAFFAGAPEPECAPSANRFSPTPRPPASFAGVRPASGYRGTVGRALTVVRATVGDALDQVIGERIAQRATPQQVGGLRSGVVQARETDDALVLTLRRYAYVNGIRVSGQFSTAGGGAMTIRGPGVRGSVRLSANGAMSGTVNGRKVRTASSSWRTAGLPASVTRLSRLTAG